MTSEDKKPPKPLLDLLEKLNDAIENGPWEHSLFFRTIRKRLEAIRDRYTKDIGLTSDAEPSPTKESQIITQRAGFIEVYISLYIAEGSNLKKWESLLNSIGSLSTARPVYKNEQDVKDLIRSKDYQQNDAYAAVLIRPDDIYQPYNKPPLDRAGRELLVLREGILRPESIVRFIHSTGLYVFTGGKLVRS